MDEETRESALKKLKAMSAHIGYADEIMDNANIEKFYENLEIDENDYLSSVLNLNIFGTNYALSKLRKPFYKYDWVNYAHAAVVDAFYSESENSIGKKTMNSFFKKNWEISTRLTNFVF